MWDGNSESNNGIVFTWYYFLNERHKLSLMLGHVCLANMHSVIYRGFALRQLPLEWLQMFPDLFAFSAICEVNGMGRSITKTIITIAI